MRRRILRFLWITLLALCAMRVFTRMFCDEPPFGPPPEMQAAVALTVCFLVAGLDASILHRRLSSH